MAKTIKDLQNEFSQDSTNLDSNSLMNDFDDKLKKSARQYDKPLQLQYGNNPSNLTEGFIEKPSTSFELHATEDEVAEFTQTSDTFISNKRKKLEDQIILKEQQKILEKEESNAGFFIKMLSIPVKEFNALQGIFQGMVAYDDENFHGNVFERMGQGATYGWTGEEDAETGERIQSGAALSKSILTGDGDVSKSSWLARLGLSLPTTVFFSIFDPMMVGFKLLGKSKASITGTYHAIHDFVNKKSINELEDIVGVGKNVVDDTIVKDIVDIAHQNGIFNHVSAKKKTKDILKVLDSKEYNLQKILASKEKIDIKDVVKEYKQFDSELRAQVKNSTNIISMRGAELYKKIEDNLTDIVSNRNYDALDELSFVKKNLNNSIGSKKTDKFIQMDTMTRMLADDKEKAKLLSWFGHDLFDRFENEVYTDMFDIIDTLNTTKMDDKKLFSFTKEQIKETLPDYIFNSGLIDLQLLEEASQNFLNKSPIYSKITQAKHINDMKDIFSDTTIKNNLSSFINNKTFKEGLLYKQYDELEKAINGQVSLLKVTKDKKLKNKIKELQKVKLEYEEVISAMKTRDLVQYINDPKGSELPVSLRNESEQAVLKTWKHLDERNEEFSNRIFEIQKRLDNELNLQNTLKERINDTIDTINNAQVGSNLKNHDELLNNLYKQFTHSTQKTQELIRQSNGLIDKLKGVFDDFNVMEDVYDVFKRNPKGFNTSKLSDYVDFKTTGKFDKDQVINKDDVLTMTEKTFTKSEYANEYLDKIDEFNTDNIASIAKKEFTKNLQDILRNKKALNNVAIKNLKEFKKINDNINKSSKKLNKLVERPKFDEGLTKNNKVLDIVNNLGIGKIVDNNVIDANIDILQDVNKSVSNIISGLSKKTKISESKGIFNKEFKELVDNHSINDIQTNVYDFLERNANIFLPAMINDPVTTVNSLDRVLNTKLFNNVLSEGEELDVVADEMANNIVDFMGDFTNLNLSKTNAKEIIKEIDNGMFDESLIKPLKILDKGNNTTNIVDGSGNIDKDKLRKALSNTINGSFKEHSNIMKELANFTDELTINENASLNKVLEKTNFDNEVIDKVNKLINLENVSNDNFRNIGKLKQYQNDSKIIGNIIKSNSNDDLTSLLDVFNKAMPKIVKDSEHWNGVIKEISNLVPDTVKPFFSKTDDLFKSTYSNAFDTLARNSQSAPKYRSILQTISDKNLMADEIRDLSNLPQNIMLDSKWELLNNFIKVRKGKGLQSNLYTLEWNLSKDKFSNFNNSIVEDMRDAMVNLGNLKIDDIPNDKRPIFNLPLLHGFTDVLPVGSSGLPFVDNNLKNLIDDLKFFVSDLPRQALLLTAGSDKSISNDLLKINKALLAANKPTIGKKDIQETILNNYMKRVNVVSGEYYGNKNDFVSHIPSASLLDTYANDAGLRKLNNKPQGLFKNNLNAKRYIGRAIDINREVGASAVSQSANFITSQFAKYEPELLDKTIKKLGFKNVNELNNYLGNNKIASEIRVNAILDTLNEEEKTTMFNIFKANNVTDQFRQAFSDDAISFDENTFSKFLIDLKNKDTNKNIDLIHGEKKLRDIDILSQDFNNIIRSALDNKLLTLSNLSDFNLPKGLNYDVTRELSSITVDELLADPITKKSLLQLDKDVYSDLFALDPILSGLNANMSTLSLVEDINHMAHATDNGMFKALEDINLENQKFYKRIPKSTAFRDIDNYFKIAMRGSKGDGRLSNEERKIIERSVEMFTKDKDSIYSLENRLANSKDKSHVYVLKEFYDRTIKPLDIDEEKVSLVYNTFEKALRTYKGITLMSPGTHFKNFAGNLFALYLSTPSLSEAVAINNNGRKIKNAFRFLQEQEQSFFKQYSKTQRAKNLAVDPAEGRRLFLQDLETNPDKYSKAQLSINKATNQNNVAPKAFNPLSTIKYSPKDVYLEGMDAINLDIIGNNFLDKMLNNKSFNINRSIEMMRDIQLGNISFKEAITTMPQLGKIFNKAGITEENFVKKMIRLNYSIMGDMTNDFKIGFLNNINQNINHSLNSIFKKDGLNVKFKTPSDLANFKAKLNNEELLNLENNISSTLEKLYNDNNKHRIIRDRLFDQVNLNKFESKYMNNIFLFYGFMKKALENQIRLFNNLDFSGLYGIQRFISQLMINQGIDNGELSPWAKDAQQIPIKIGNKALLLKVDNPFVPSLPNVNLMNEIINSTNPFIKYVVESAASNSNLFLNNDYSSKLQQLYQTFVPASLQKPATITQNIANLDGESSIADILDAIAPSIFNVENMDANEIYNLEKAFELLPSVIDSIIADDEKVEAVLNLLPYLGYSPYKLRLTTSNYFS